LRIELKLNRVLRLSFQLLGTKLDKPAAFTMSFNCSLNFEQGLCCDAPTGGDPWEDERWLGKKWTVYRGKAYDLTPYMDRHPGGSWLINLAIGRDCTALFESYHLRPDVAGVAMDCLGVGVGLRVGQHCLNELGVLVL
jgi:hypothetical protein